MAPLTAEDRLDIQELCVRCNYCADMADTAGFAGLFTADGVLEVATGAVRGQKALRAFIAQHAQSSPGTRHFITNIFVEATDDGARVRAYYQSLQGEGHDLLRIVGLGRYEDSVVRSAQGWRIASRKVIGEMPCGIRGAAIRFAT